MVLCVWIQPLKVSSFPFRQIQLFTGYNLFRLISESCLCFKSKPGAGAGQEWWNLGFSSGTVMLRCMVKSSFTCNRSKCETSKGDHCFGPYRDRQPWIDGETWESMRWMFALSQSPDM